MTDLKSRIQNLRSRIAGGLIVSFQAPANSPLSKPEIIAAFAQTAEMNGAAGVRIDSPENIRAVRNAVKIPILGIYKIVSNESEVYITPTFDAAQKVAAAGADIIALDATFRERPDGAICAEIVSRIHTELGLPVMADVATFEEGLKAEQFGCDFIGTTLAGYTAETKHLGTTDFDLVENLSKRLSVPVICEGRLKTPRDVSRAFECGAFAVVVGGAITGVDNLVKEFVAAAKR